MGENNEWRRNCWTRFNQANGFHPEHDPEPEDPQYSPMEDAGEDPNATVGGPSSSSTTKGGGKRKASTLNVTEDYAELKRRRAEDDREWSKSVGSYEMGRRLAAGDGEWEESQKKRHKEK